MVQRHMNATRIIAYWIVVSSRETWSYLREKGEWAFSEERSRLAYAVRPGDKGVVYLRSDGPGRPGALGGAILFIGPPYKAIGSGRIEHLYPLRLPIHVTSDLKDPIPFKEVVKGIEYIKNKENWGSYFQGRATIRIGEKDFRALDRAIVHESTSTSGAGPALSRQTPKTI